MSDWYTPRGRLISCHGFVTSTRRLHIPPLDETYEGFSVVLEGLDTVSNAMINCVKVHAAMIHRRYNTFLPIGNLPPEVLGHIFFYAIQRDEQTSLRQLHNVASVCFSWYQIALKTPSLWTMLECRQPRDVSGWKQAMVRSGTLGLDVEFSFGADRTIEFCVNTVNLFEDVVEHRRWKALTIVRDPSCDELVDELLEDMWPLSTELERLTIIGDQRPVQPLPWVLPSIVQGNLLYLHTSRTLFTLPEPASHSFKLRRLVVEDFRLNKLFAEKLLNLIGSCPQLETLHLRKLSWVDDAPNLTDATSLELQWGEDVRKGLPLPNLSSFLIEESTSIGALLLLRIRPGPNVRNVVLDFGTEKDIDVIHIALLGCFQTETSMIRRVLSTPSRDGTLLRINVTWITDHGLTIATTSGRAESHNVTVRLKLYNLGTFFDKYPLLDYEGALPVRFTIQVDGRMWKDRADRWNVSKAAPALLPKLPTLEELVFRTENEDGVYYRWIRYLSAPLQGTTTWAAPRLKKVVLPAFVSSSRKQRNEATWMGRARLKAAGQAESSVVAPEIRGADDRKLDVELGKWEEEELTPNRPGELRYPP